MTIKQLIKQLKRYDENIEVCIQKPLVTCGSSATGFYNSGTTPVKIDEIKFFDADILGALSKLDKTAHIELISTGLEID